MDTAVQYYRPQTRVLNVRVIIFAAVVLTIIGYPTYTFLSQYLSGGIIKHGNTYDVNLKALGFFVFDGMNGTVNDIPAKWRALDGKRVQLEGQVYDLQEADKITQFEFVYSIQKCCFGGPPLVQERVFVSAPPGVAFDRPYNMARVTGILHVKITHDSLGKISTVYTMDAESLEALQD